MFKRPLKIAAIALACAPMLAFAGNAQQHADRFAGFAFNVGLGYGVNSGTADITEDSGTTHRIKETNEGLSGKVGVSYRYKLSPNWYIGGGLSLGKLGITNHFDYTLSFFGLKLLHLNGKVTTGIGIHPYVSLDYRYHHNLFGVFAGAAFTTNTTSVSFDLVGNKGTIPDSKVSETGIFVGANFAQPLTDHFALSESISYIKIGNITNNNPDIPEVSKVVRSNLHATMTLIGLSYKF